MKTERHKRFRGSPAVPATSDVMMIQESLQVAGFYQGSIDGIVGRSTESALRAYKKARRMPVSNEISAALIEHFRESA